MKVSKKIAGGKFGPVFILLLIICSISLLTRIVLLIYSGSSFDYTFLNLVGTFAIGLFYDLCMSSFLIIPVVLHIWLTNEKIYNRPGKWIAIFIYLSLIIAIAFFKIIPEEYNKIVPLIVLLLVIARFLIYLLLLAKGESFRLKWRTIILLADFFLLTYLLLFNAVSEFFFWDEFGSRYNFIAVDYLVYTNEVAGNVNESYPVIWIVIGVLLLTVPVIVWIRPFIKQSVYVKQPFLQRTVIAVSFLLVAAIVYFGVTSKYRKFSNNEYANELAGNGLYEFGAAFLNNELDFYKFYKTLPDREAFALVREQLQAPNAKFTSDDVFNLERDISYDEPEKKYNIVLISVESFSASFMKAFGETRNLTPQLDSLAPHSLFFSNLYATGTRTVRGLECLSLSIPPVPGQSVVRRPGNEDLFSAGALLKSKGYITQFIYGGYSSFDNMGFYFSHNNYEVIDRSAIPANEIHYANIWGVADEDLFTMALKKLDANYATGKPFFSQIMTVSNHRPYTYPEGRIDISPATQSREGAVKYTDYAIGRFIKEASAKPWFNNTIFVVVADHCAYAAGKVELPVTGYHIPMLIYSPALIKPQRYDRLTSQMDIIPTVLGFLKMKYRSKFFGQDIFSLPEGKERAFISTYQGLGYLRNGQLVIQMPPKKVDQYIPDFITGKAIKTQLNDSLVKQAIAYYQTASWLLKNKKFGKD
ncbi:MAG: sulfatase-like hydrolase/transferase [Bacteroidetes bacterium]|nr:sulfatase-like hydrolase/transferase [Bacteroidota bacterium]